MRHNDLQVSNIDSLSRIPIDKYSVDLGFSHNVFEDNGFVLRFGVGYESSKNQLDLFSDDAYKADLNILKTINDKISAELPVSYKRILPNSPIIDFGVYSDLIVKPSVRYRSENYRAKLGIEFITGDEVNYLFPIVDIELIQVIEEIGLRLFTQSDYRRNSLYELSEIHPYFQSSFSSYSGYYQRTFNLTASRAVGPLNTALTFSYETYDNDNNFFESTSFNSTIRQGLGYVDRDAFVINPKLEYKLDDQVQLGLSASYFVFLTDSLDLYYRPDFTLAFHGKEHFLNNKLELSQDLTFNSARSVSQEVFDGILFRLDSFLDLSLGLKYHASPTFSFYIKGANLLGAEYDLWQLQPVFQRQVWGGLKLRI